MCLWLCSCDSGTWHSPHCCTFWLNRWRRKGGRPHHQVAGNSRFLSFVYSFHSCNWVYLYIVFVLLYSICHSLCHCHWLFLLLCVDVIQSFTCLLCVRAINQYSVGNPSIPTSVLFPRDSVSYVVGYNIKLATVTGFFFLCVWTSFSLLWVVLFRCHKKMWWGSARKSKRPHQLPLIHASRKTYFSINWGAAGVILEKREMYKTIQLLSRTVFW